MHILTLNTTGLNNPIKRKNCKIAERGEGSCALSSGDIYK